MQESIHERLQPQTSSNVVPFAKTGTEAVIIEAADMPALYTSAVQALAECDAVDECQGWADRAAALSCYARQRTDQTLFDYAKRIQARAVRRCGELVKQIEPKRGARTDLGRAPTRSSAAKSAGLSPHQLKQAQRVAAIPAEDFERQVESSPPPTITELAAQGKSDVSTTLKIEQALDVFKAGHPISVNADMANYREAGREVQALRRRLAKAEQKLAAAEAAIIKAAAREVLARGAA